MQKMDKRFGQEIHQKKIYRWQLSTAHLNDGYNEGTNKTKCDEDVQKLELSYISGGNSKWYSARGIHLGNCLKS